MRFHRGDIAEFEVRFARMAVANAAEVGALGAGRMLPATNFYKSLEEQGALRLFFAYASDGQPAGYQVFLVATHPHYAGVQFAQADAVYVSPEHRGYLAGRFLLWADETLKAEGIGAVSRSSPRRGPMGDMLLNLGYKEQETHYIKEL